MSTSPKIQQVADWLGTLNAYQLADMAGCASPDSLTSPGAVFLVDIREAFIELMLEVDKIPDEREDDRLVGIADDAPSIYTFPKWQQFTDLAAWQADIDDYADGCENDLDKLGTIALYVIARDLVNDLQSAAEATFEGLD